MELNIAMVLLNMKVWNTNLCAKVAITSCSCNELYPTDSLSNGGYNSSNRHEGLATLAHKFAFQVFVFSNTIAMFSFIFYLNDIELSLLSLDLSLPFSMHSLQHDVSHFHDRLVCCAAQYMQLASQHGLVMEPSS